MRRRAYLATTTAMIAISGCAGGGSGDNGGSVDDCTVEHSTESVDPVSITVDGRVKDGTADAVIDLDWNARTQYGTTSSPSSNAGYSPDDGEKTVVVKVEFINNTDSEVAVDSKLFDGFVETPELKKEVSRINISARIVSEVTLKPEGRTQGYMAYHIPVNSTSFTLQAVSNYNGTNVGFTPNCNKDLMIELSEFS